MRRNPLLYTFFIFLLGITIIDICKEDKRFSELENRNLRGQVEFSLEKYFDGSYPKKYEEYMSDQFILRDNWIDLKSRSEYLLGKLENNNIIYGKDGYLFEKFTELDKRRVTINIDSINKLIENSKTPVSILIAPNSYEVYKEKLPLGAPVINQKDELEKIYIGINGENKINLTEKFIEKSEESLYYKTDHHWTTKGAYLAYRDFIESIGYKAINLDKYNKNEVEGFFGTYFSKAKPFNVASDKLTYYDFSGITMKIDDKLYNSLYDYSKLDIRDKYSLFLYGNNPLTIINNSNLKNGKKLVIFKDSYANSFVPFLTENFEEIHVIDLRSFSESVSEYINNNSFDNVLVLYNFINFTRDTNIIKLKS